MAYHYDQDDDVILLMFYDYCEACDDNFDDNDCLDYCKDGCNYAGDDYGFRDNDA